MINKDSFINVAPCGMNCSLCLANQRTKNTCAGCNALAGIKVNHCSTCSIRNCEELPETGFCYSCKKFPCKRIKHLDKRYWTNYGMSMISNLQMIETTGIDEFNKREKEKWTCSKCGSLLCVHRPVCLKCGNKNDRFPEHAHLN
ncbi:MAG: DUF3795 domain-containing protein [Bacteroidales bacterium]